MKIALVSQEYPPETARGGLGTQTHLKACGLAGRGHSVFVISRSIDQERREIKDDNITVIRLPGMESSLPEMTECVQWISHSLGVAVEIEALHKRVGLDLIDFPEWGAEGYVYLLNRTDWNRVPCVIQLHGPLVMFAHTMGWPSLDSEFYRVGAHMEESCIRMADAVYSSSACSARWARDYCHLSQAVIPTIHMGVDARFFVPQERVKNDHPTIIYAGKLVPNKGVMELVEAAGRLSGEFAHLRLRLIGRGEQSFIARILRKAQEKGAEINLELAGFVASEDLPREFSQADVFAAPSYYEGGPGFVYLEAMACGLPVIGCGGSGIDEIITNGETGFLVPPGDTEALTRVLRLILSDHILQKDMGNKARQFVLEHAQSRACLPQLEEFYLSVIRRPGASSRVS